MISLPDTELEEWLADARARLARLNESRYRETLSGLIDYQTKIASVLDEVLQVRRALAKHGVPEKFQEATSGTWESIAADPNAPGWVQTTGEADVCDTYSGLNRGVAQTVPSAPKHIANAKFIAAAHNAIDDILKVTPAASEHDYTKHTDDGDCSECAEEIRGV